MPKRDYYEIPGVPRQATPAEIKRAYRRIALAVHPDVGVRSDPEHFREAQEAYQVLGDPERRRSYDISVGTRRPLVAEPLRGEEPVMIIDDTLTLQPSLEEVLECIGWNFLGHGPESGGAYRRIRMEAILEPEEARFGCRLPFNLPCYDTCERCGGSGGSWDICPTCRGQGMDEGMRRFVLEIPPGSRGGERYEIDLSDGGMNLVLDVSVVVP